MKLGFIGLGKMGLPMAIRLLKAGHEVVVVDHHAENIAAATAAGATSLASSDQLAAHLPAPSVVWLMIGASHVDAELDRLLPTLAAGSLLVDGGNSDFRQTRQRAARCAEAGLTMMDVGTSGGTRGAQHGYCTMAGGTAEGYERIEPLLKALSQPGGHGYFGPSGAGHYVKMIHNGIEYGMMQAYAEGYRLLADGKDYPELDLAALAQLWQHGSIITSTLNGIMAQTLAANPQLDGVDGFVAESGEARWMIETASAQAIAVPAIAAALMVRQASQRGKVDFGTKLLAATRNGFGGHAINREQR